MLLIEKNYYFCIGRIKMNYNPRELGHKSSTIKKIFGRSATATGLAKQGSSPVQTALDTEAFQEIERLFFYRYNNCILFLILLYLFFYGF